MPKPISPLIDKHAQEIAETIHPLWKSQQHEKDYLVSSSTAYDFNYATVEIKFTFHYSNKKEKKDHARL